MPDNYFASYLPLLLHFVIAFVVAGAIVTLSWLIGQRKPKCPPTSAALPLSAMHGSDFP